MHTVRPIDAIEPVGTIVSPRKMKAMALPKF